MKTHYFQIIFKVKTTRSETAEKSEGGQEDHGLIGAFSKVFQNSFKKSEISRFRAGKQEFLKSCFSPKFPQKNVDFPSVFPPASCSLCFTLLSLFFFCIGLKSCFLQRKGIFLKQEFWKDLVFPEYMRLGVIFFFKKTFF